MITGDKIYPRSRRFHLKSLQVKMSRELRRLRAGEFLQHVHVAERLSLTGYHIMDIDLFASRARDSRR